MALGHAPLGDAGMDGIELIDTHCHLDQEPLAGSVEAVLERARQAGVRRCLTVGTSLDASRSSVALARRFPMLACAVGVHPHDAHTVSDELLRELEALAQEPRVVAIGEVGLDYSRDHSPREAQQRALRAFIAMARLRGLPLSIHCRAREGAQGMDDAYAALLTLLHEEAGPPVRGVLHCASGSAAFIEQALALGLHVSFAGNVTFANALALRALVPLVPDERLLLETDAPFLAPEPVRGRSNEPAYVRHTASVVAGLRGTTLEALGALTSRNARQLFRLDAPPRARA